MAVLSPFNLEIGQVVMFLIETSFNTHFDIQFESCSYMSDFVLSEGSFFGSFVSNSLPINFSTGYTFDNNYAGFIARVYNNDNQSNQLACDARLIFV